MQNIEEVYNAVLRVTDYKGRTNFINVKRSSLGVAIKDLRNHGHEVFPCREIWRQNNKSIWKEKDKFFVQNGLQCYGDYTKLSEALEEV